MTDLLISFPSNRPISWPLWGGPDSADMAMQSSGTQPLSADAREWIAGLAEALNVPWRWRAADTLEIGPGEPWVTLLVHFSASGDWHSVWFERSPRPALQRGMVGAASTARIVRSVMVDISSGMEWNSWLSWFEQRHGIDSSVPDWVVRGLMRKTLRHESEACGSATARQGANYRRAAQRAQEALAAAHPDEYRELLDQFLVVEALSTGNGN